MKYFVLGTVVSVFFCSTVFGVWWLVCSACGLELSLVGYMFCLLLSFVGLYFRNWVEEFCEGCGDEFDDDLTVY